MASKVTGTDCRKIFLKLGEGELKHWLKKSALLSGKPLVLVQFCATISNHFLIYVYVLARGRSHKHSHLGSHSQYIFYTAVWYVIP